MNSETTDSRYAGATQGAASLLQIAMIGVAAVLIWIAVVFGASYSSGIASNMNTQAVYVGGQEIGTVHLFPLTKSGGLQIYFEPLNEDLSVISMYSLSWWQAVNRPDREGYPRMDMQSGKNKLPDPFGDDNDPAYYTHAERNDERIQRKIFRDGKYWLLDAPDVGNGVQYEAWLVRQNGYDVERLATIQWGVDATNSEIVAYHHPRFAVKSNYDLTAILESSGFGNVWSDVAAEPVQDGLSQSSPGVTN